MGGRAALRAALRYLELGAALGIFPEGTRRKNGERDTPKSGAVMLASRSGALVLPVHVGPVPSPLERFRGGRLEVHIGEPRLVSDLGAKNSKSYGALAEDLVDDIYSLSGTGGTS